MTTTARPVETKAVATYRASLIVELKKRRADIRRGTVLPRDQNGSVVKAGNSVSINASVGANGELTRLIHILESETT